jgi:hypothetical protein
MLFHLLIFIDQTRLLLIPSDTVIFQNLLLNCIFFADKIIGYIVNMFSYYFWGVMLVNIKRWFCQNIVAQAESELS